MAPTRTQPTQPKSRQTTLSSHFKTSGSITRSAAPAKGKHAANGSSAASKNMSDRVGTDVLLAIQPHHLKNICSGQKNHEYRKYRLKDGVERLWFYETRGTEQNKGSQAITHIATIPATVRRQPGSVPTEPFGIGNSDFNEGKKVSKYGYPIVELYELAKPIALREMTSKWGIGAPMGWSYVKKDMWMDRWGLEDERNDKVKQILGQGSSIIETIKKG